MGPLLVARVRTPGLLVEEAPLPDAHGSLLVTVVGCYTAPGHCACATCSEYTASYWKLR